MVKSMPLKIDIPQQDDLLKNRGWECEEKPNYKVYQSGSHINSNFIQVYVPNHPYRDEKGKTKAVIYMHGFALCMPKFYEQHLEELVEKGYYVLFPGFQKSNYPDNPDSDENISDKKQTELVNWSEVIKFIRDTSKHISKGRLRSVLRKIIVAAFKVRLFLAISLIIGLISVTYYFVDHRYGKHLIKLIRTVRYSLFQSPSTWIDNAIKTTDNAWEMLCQNDSQLAEAETDFYLFGHSLGGLLALSWISYLKQDNTQLNKKFYPQQILVADPAPNTISGIPKTVTLVLQLLNSRLIRRAIDIKKTGLDIDVPVAILHGDNDKLVKPAAWDKPGFCRKKSNFDYIASADKKIYFSLSDKQENLSAFHNQAVTDTTYFSDALFKKFGGVKHGENAYNHEYIWSGLDLVIKESVKASELLDKFPLKTIKVVDKLPKKALNIKLILIAVLSVMGLAGLGYFLWSQGII
ncbi:hypothetical protein [Calothrix sp. CCY 0018]|uniref:hypothetical protein n=1 Tax=Calothrix sp. CCY 0018 TaxID=3103864 RepID=UPI0039C6F1D7